MNARRPHIHGAKEQYSKTLRDFPGNNGTNATHTAPGASRSNAFAGHRFRQLMASARTAMAAAPHMSKTFWSHAVLDVANKGNYLTTAEEGRIQPSPRKFISNQCPEFETPSPATFLPWGKFGRAVSAEKFKKELENRAERACYLRKLGAD